MTLGENRPHRAVVFSSRSPEIIATIRLVRIINSIEIGLHPVKHARFTDI